VVESLGGELGPIVDADLLRQGTAIDAYDRENARDIGTTEAAARPSVSARWQTTSSTLHLPAIGLMTNCSRLNPAIAARRSFHPGT
jgi:hypothetical protein